MLRTLWCKLAHRNTGDLERWRVEDPTPNLHIETLIGQECGKCGREKLKNVRS